MSQVCEIKYNCCYCGKERRQTVYYTMNPLVFGPKEFHGFDGLHHSCSVISRCPHCGFVSYYLTHKIPGITSKDIEQINVEASDLFSSLSISKQKEDLKIYIKHFLTLKRAKYDDTNQLLFDMANCIYRLFISHCVINEFADDFLNLYTQLGINDIQLLDLIRRLGRFSFVLKELEKNFHLKNGSEMIEIEKEYCSKNLDYAILDSEVQQVHENGLKENFIRKCFFCGSELHYGHNEYIHKCEKCGRNNKRYGKYHTMLHGGIPKIID